MKGLLLAGGTGSRLNPITTAVNKHLLPIYDKPMIYYPLTSLLLAGVRSITVVSSKSGTEQLADLLHDGSQWGVEISYKVQGKAEGVAQAIEVGLYGSNNDGGHLVILGDNIFFGNGMGREIIDFKDKESCYIWTQEVENPENFGIVQLDKDETILKIEEKPKSKIGNLAITGLYYFPEGIADKIRNLEKSARDEYEVTDILNLYREEKNLKLVSLKRGVFWLDAGTTPNLLEASNFVKIIQTRQGHLVGSPDEAAWRMGYIDEAKFRQIVNLMPDTAYKDQLSKYFTN